MDAGPDLTAADSLGWDGIGSIIILLVASVSLGDWLPPSSFEVVLLRLFWVFLYLAAVTILMRRHGTAWLGWTLRHQPALCILLAAAWVSSLWSLAPLVSLQKATSLVGTTVLGLFIGYTCPPQRIMHFLRWTFTLLIISSILAILLLPVAPTPSIGWRGIMGHKNMFGVVAALATVFFLVSTQRRDVQPAWGAMLCTLSVIALLQSRSRASLAAATVTLALLAYLWIAAATGRPILVTLRRMSLALVLCVSLLPFVVGPFASALGNDDPLNGRTTLWAGVSTILGERPLTGYGYEIVWARKDATMLPHIPATAHRSAASAHNSILNIASELGVPTAIVACFYLLAAFFNSARLLDRAPSAFSVFVFLFLIGVTLDGFAESHLLRIHSMLWILLVALTVAVQRSLERLGRGASSPDDSV